MVAGALWHALSHLDVDAPLGQLDKVVLFVADLLDAPLLAGGDGKVGGDEKVGRNPFLVNVDVEGLLLDLLMCF